MSMPEGRFLDGKKVLIAFEHKLTQELLLSALKQCGAGQTMSGPPPDMLARIREFKPDLILCEYAMDQVNGADFVRFIRKEMKIAAPAVMLIHRGDAEALTRSHAVGVEQTVLIPFATVDIMTALKKVSGTESSQPKRELYFGD